MKPTSVRSMLAAMPSRSAMIWSRPGAVNPVQDATTMWVNPPGASPSAATAAKASSVAWRS